MNQWANAMQSMNGPGQGAGNVPYAPGVMSGNYQGQQPSADNRQGGGGIGQLYAGLHQQQGMDQAKQQMTQFTSGADPSQLGGMPQGLNWTPDTQRQVMAYLMQVLKNTRTGDQVSTTGGMTSRGW